ncbi:MAG: DUF128 domain-containing protein [Spirochaetales bacterium]|jgi:HTH-type transcriptional regulator, global nitrogen regulator NrpRI|nr:DUF128 domain-containing protein [Spirochaetales bacterium]
MQDRIEKTRLAILRILKEQNKPISSQKIAEKLIGSGLEIPDRTIRFNLLAMDKDGFTEYQKKHGRRITQRGILEVEKARVFDKVGFLDARINKLTYDMSFDLSVKAGTVVVNGSLIKNDDIEQACSLMKRVYQAGYAMGTLMAFFGPGEQIGEVSIPEGYLGIGTVCSVTLNGVLLANRIPTTSVFGGLLELRQGRPNRFVEIIRYDGTSIDPLEIFIKSGMTDYTGATEDGNGLIGASFRVIPENGRERVLEIAEQLTDVGLGGFMEIGVPNQPLYGIPVNVDCVGAIVIGGLNPVAILVENGIDVYSKTLSGLLPYEKLFSYEDAGKEAKKYL